MSSIQQGRVNAPDLSNIERSSINRYGYIANLCVLKSSRRKGVARNMLNFAIRLAKEYGKQYNLDATVVESITKRLNLLFV